MNGHLLPISFSIKRIWGSPAGKARLARRLVQLLPPHHTYVEPFVGSGAVLFAKDPAPCEVINDADNEIATAYRIIKRLSGQDIRRLRACSWVGEKNLYLRLYRSSPSNDFERLRRFLYMARFSFGRFRSSSFDPSAAGRRAFIVERVLRFRPRLNNVKVRNGDYEQVVREFDHPQTVHFLDPPYTGFNAEVGEGSFDERRFFLLLKSIRGRFLLTYGNRGSLPKMLAQSRFCVRRIQTVAHTQARHSGNASILTQLVVANYRLPPRLR